MRRAVGGALLALALTVPVPVAGASTTVPSGAAASGAATTDLPAGVSIDHVEWLDGGEDEQGRRVDLYVNSAAMPGEPLKVEMQLARDWYTRPEQTFASVWTLGGIYGSDESNSWLTQADAAEWYADKNVNLIMPVGGGATFYTDWVNQDNGETINWETFLTEELPAVLAKDFRSDDRRAIMGVSMGATASVTLAGRHPDKFRFAGSFSGYLDMSSPGMPQAVDAMLKVWGRSTAANMWGPLGSQGWADHDPKLLLDNLRDTTVFVYSGSGRLTPGEPTNDPITATTDQSGEALSRMSTERFLSYTEDAGVPVHADMQPTGAHNWNAWVPVMKDAWPLIADSLDVERG